MSDTALWKPAHPEATAMMALAARCSDRAGRPLTSFRDLHAYSIEAQSAFWDIVWDDLGIIGDKGGTVLENAARMPDAAFFPEGRINYAENCLAGDADAEAIVFRGEDKTERRMTRGALRAAVARMQAFLAEAGVGAGDRVAAMMPNMPETIVVCMAAASLGAVFSSCSPDFGERGVLDRFGQIEPTVFVSVDGYWYNGKPIDISAKVGAVAQVLAPAAVVIVPYLDDLRAQELATEVAGAVLYPKIEARAETEPAFTRVAFNAPLFILFSSGTTGVPKCIVHGAGGTLIQHMKEHRYHADIKAGDRVFYFTTCGWMMWNWLITALASEATLILYDGSPFAPAPTVLWDYAQDEAISFFGTSAKYLDALKKEGVEPKESHDLSALRTIASTGSPLAAESFRWVYEAIRTDVHLASISGGTDIVSCFVLGVPTLPVYAGEIQGPGLGMATDVAADDGTHLASGKGELVCRKPFPSMPIMFWNDPAGKKYRAAYFDRFENIWCHGDFAEWTSHGGIIIHGRSDATLNPGGVRIGTAEIYAQVEQIPEVIEALAIGQDFDGDVRVVLFVRLADGATLTDDLVKTIRTQVRTGATPRHVPAKVVAVADIPRTKSGKIVELAVRDIVHGREIKNREALANPEALELFRDLEALQS
ncbi:acetoacetate--CoA ligase [Acuticoccus sp. MNP-M23]|uniref:acetoacetate--CoA ligase n=1 Tax=Acuticoccus sp. MNP-M23 TaxID=3072793 RepID=UPI002815166A|nr:acetoacetate--CoA ligase [Acuticoccus sp. MNP-M23]WMS43881.1 acetoacetate--CoA ligase [Acuticoccus sp. MNP-M23]